MMTSADQGKDDEDELDAFLREQLEDPVFHAHYKAIHQRYHHPSDPFSAYGEAMTTIGNAVIAIVILGVEYWRSCNFWGRFWILVALITPAIFFFGVIRIVV